MLVNLSRIGYQSNEKNGNRDKCAARMTREKKATLKQGEDIMYHDQDQTIRLKI